jgi:hypothetical protein
MVQQLLLLMAVAVAELMVTMHHNHQVDQLAVEVQELTTVQAVAVAELAVQVDKVGDKIKNTLGE